MVRGQLDFMCFDLVSIFSEHISDQKVIVEKKRCRLRLSDWATFASSRYKKVDKSSSASKKVPDSEQELFLTNCLVEVSKVRV